jgi:signal transduction histidine kinase
LRTPLTSLRLAAANGLHPDATPEEMRQALRAVERSSEAMTKLTSLLLTLARLDHGQTSLELEHISVLPLILEVLSAPTIQPSPKVVVEVPTDMVLPVNPSAFKQVVQNLVENAQAHTPTEETIWVRGAGSTIEVADTGIGISPEHLPHLFERFYRVDPSRNRVTGGFGLGLAIVESLVSLQKGEIRVESRVGEGTTFFLDFQKSLHSSQDPHN